MDQSFMKSRAVFPLVLSLALPMALSMLVNSLYNIVDSFFIARISEKAMTAISLVFPLQNIASAVSIGFGVGVNAAVAFYLGAGDRKRANGAASVGLLLSLVHAAVMTVVLVWVTPSFLRSFSADAEVVSYGVRYGRIVLGLCVVGQVHLILEKLFQAIGRMKTSMAAMIAGCVTNIVLDPIMIFGFGPVPAMGIEGGAAATVIGQAVSLGIYLALYLRGGLGPVRISLSEGWRERRLAGRIYGVGIPAILNQALPSLLITALNGILAAVSDTGVLVLGIYYKLQTFIFLTTNGIVQGIRPIISYNYGAGEYERVHRIFRTALLCALVVMSAGVVLCLGMPETLIRLFASDEDVVRSGAEALRIISIGFLFSAVSFSVCGTMEALGRGFSSFIISLLRYAAVILPLALLLSRWMGETGVWHAFWITEVIAAAVSALLYRRMWSKERGRQSI